MRTGRVQRRHNASFSAMPIASPRAAVATAGVFSAPPLALVLGAIFAFVVVIIIDFVIVVVTDLASAAAGPAAHSAQAPVRTMGQLHRRRNKQ